MEYSFLQLVARNLYDNFGDKLFDFVMVFPNKRAGKFFNECLYEVFQHPFKAPECCTISDLVKQSSDFVLADELELIYLLYKVFTKHFYGKEGHNPTQEQEPFDKFYSWGLVLLSDFDDVDKNLVDPKQLFRNINDYKSYDRLFDFLSEEQRQFLERFFQGVQHTGHNHLQHRFISVWNILLSVYEEFNQVLWERKKAYEGALYRQAVEQLKHGSQQSFPKEKYVFIGFNVLNKAEKILFDTLKHNQQALFYWDYDRHYVENRYQEAGVFMRENLQNFPSLLNAPALFNNIQQPKEQVRIVSTSGKTIQARFLSDAINAIPETYGSVQQRDVAVVLCDENILQPVLYGLPATFGGEETKVNITMGYPFQATVLCSLIEAWKTYHLNGIRNGRCRLKYMEPLLLHPYWLAVFPETENYVKDLKNLNNHYPLWGDFPETFRELLKECLSGEDMFTRLFELMSALAGMKQQNPEVLFRAYKTVQRLHDFVVGESLKLSTKLAFRTIDSVLRSVIVPLEGDTIEGLQIMGILETRNLDFKHLILLSVNEGVLPKKNSDSSFIPFSFRYAYGLTTPERKTAVFAYYFLRLLQRCESVTFLYDSSASEAGAGEMSRFLQQVRIETRWNITYENLSAKLELPAKPVFAPRHGELVNRCLQRYVMKEADHQSLLSPSALNVYIDCSLRFYFQYVLGIKTKMETTEDFSALEFGTAFHMAAELLYREITRQPLGNPWNNKKTYPVTKSDLSLYLLHGERENKYNENVVRLVKRALNYTYFHKGKIECIDVEFPLNARQELGLQVLVTYLSRLIKKDYEYAPFDIVAIEYRVSDTFSLLHRPSVQVCLGGIVDRIDLKEGILRIVDYKSGGMAKSITKLDALFQTSANRYNHGLQILFYAWLIYRNPSLICCPFDTIQTAVLYVNRFTQITGDDLVKVMDKTCVGFENLMREFEDNMQICLNTLFSEEFSFLPCNNEQICTYCDYADLCVRSVNR